MDSLINTGRLVQKFLPKQTDIDKGLKIKQRKVPKGMHLPVTIGEMQAGYLFRLYFKDVHLYLAQNKLPRTKTAIHEVESLAEIYVLLDSFLFILVTILENKMALLAIPEMCTDIFYHSIHLQDIKV